MDLEALLQSRGDENPSGEDLVYDLAFMTLELAAQPGEERQAGDKIIAAEDPDFKEVTEAALAVMEQSHDLRAGVFLSMSELRLRGFPGFADGTGYLRGCLENFWDTCHPQLDADDNNDPTQRVNVILSLAAPDTILRGIRITPLSDSRTFGRISLRDIAIAEGEMTPTADMEDVPDSSSIGAAFQDTDPAYLQAALAGARQSLENVRAINAKFDAEVPGRGPDLDPLIKLLGQVVARLEPVAGATPQEAGAPAEAASAGAPAAAAPSGGGAVGAISSPSDVQNALDRIIAYYKRSEPSSPVPILLARAKRLVSADFLTIVKDMAPNGVENVNLIGGLADD
ncbi:MAG: type VI secretion system protein TssA [Paracoccaceae bacterium]